MTALLFNLRRSPLKRLRIYACGMEVVKHTQYLPFSVGISLLESTSARIRAGRTIETFDTDSIVSGSSAVVYRIGHGRREIVRPARERYCPHAAGKIDERCEAVVTGNFLFEPAQHPPTLPIGRFFTLIEIRIQRGIVVHLVLPIHLKVRDAPLDLT